MQKVKLEARGAGAILKVGQRIAKRVSKRVSLRLFRQGFSRRHRILTLCATPNRTDDWFLAFGRVIASSGASRQTGALHTYGEFAELAVAGVVRRVET